MSRLLDLKPDDEADVVNRVVMQVHRAIDDLAVESEANSEQFRKTVFNIGEDTVVDRPKKTPEPPTLSEPSDVFFHAPVEQAGQAFPSEVTPTRDPLQVTGHEYHEYSSFSTIGNGHPGMSNGRKLMLVAAIVVLLSVVTAFMAYQLLDP